MLDELRDLFLAALKFDGEDAMPLVRNWNLAVKRVQDFVDKLTDKDPNAVPVVRCKDCKHYNNSREQYDDDVCEIMYYCDGTHRTACERDFCSYGERKGGDE